MCLDQSDAGFNCVFGQIRHRVWTNQTQRSLCVWTNQTQRLTLCVFPEAVSKPGEGKGLEDSLAPCPEDYAQFCEHGQCEMRHSLPTCR